jgi:hypothetical protein
MNLVEAIKKVESGGNSNAIGDRKLRYSAYGSMQIRWPAVQDVNRAFGTNYRARQCLGNDVLSEEIFTKYCKLYANKKMLGREPTPKDFCRLWNGGIYAMLHDPHPNPKIEKMLTSYWNKINSLLD